MDNSPKTSPSPRELLLKLRRALESKEKSDEAAKLTNLSQVAINEWHDNKAALDFLRQALTIQQQIEDKPGQCATLTNMAQLYQGWGDNQAALDHLQQALAIQQEIKDEAGEQATREAIIRIGGGPAGAPKTPAPVEEKPARPAPVAAAAPATAAPTPVTPAKPPAAQPVAPFLPEPNAALASAPGTLVTFGQAEKPLTLRYLQQAILPLLAAIGELQQIMDEVQGKPTQEMVIRGLAQSAPLRAGLDGVTPALALLRDTIAPWRREYAERIAKLDEQQQLVEINQIRAGLLEKRIAATPDRAEADKLKSEAARLQAETDRLQAENEKTRSVLYRARVNLAMDLLNQLEPNLAQADWIGYGMRLLAPLETLTSSSLEIIPS